MPHGSVAPFESFGGSNTGILGPAAIAVTPPFAIITTTLPAGRVQHRDLARLRVAEGTTPYRCSLRRGHLPKGRRLSASGVLSGRPSKPGRFAFTVRVRDSARHHLT